MMSPDAFLAFGLVRAGSLLALGAIAYCALKRRLDGRVPPALASAVYGLVFAAAGLLEIVTAVEVSNGVHVDLRSVNVAITTIYAGPGAGLLATLVFAAADAAVDGGPVLRLQLLLLAASFIASALYAARLRRLEARPDLIGLIRFGAAFCAMLILLAFWSGSGVFSHRIIAVAGPAWFMMAFLAIVVVGSIIGHIEGGNALKRSLEERESELRAIMDNAPIAMFLKDREGKFRMVNPCFRAWYDVADADTRDRAYVGRVTPGHADFIHGSDAAVVRDGRTIENEHRTRVARAGIENVLVTKFPVRDERGQVTGIAGFILDVTARKRAEAALRESRERFRALVEHSNDVILVLAADGILTYRSPSATDVLGYSADDLVGRSILDRLYDEDVAAFADMLRTISTAPGRRAAGRSRVRHEDGTLRQMSWSARNASDVPGIGGIVINSRDVTDEQRLESQLIQAQKMEAVGQLAGGMAHDFNNLLGAIRGFAGFLQDDLPADSPQSGFATRIISACDRGRELVQQILAFARQGGGNPGSSDLAGTVPDTIELVRAALPASTQIEISRIASELIVAVNPAQIAQILLNLCLNANDALGGEAGLISIAVDSVKPGERDHAAPGAAAEAGGKRLMSGALDPARAYARLRVSDTGSGMEATVLARIFDPFFTTKERGRGTGLGLSVVHGIVVNQGGACEVWSRPDAGTVFTIYLPITTRVAAPDDEKRPPRLPAGHARLLVVDDEADIGDMLMIGLERLGYEVAAIDDPEEAVAVFADAPDAWDLIICDHVMPRLHGLGVLHQMRAARPDVPFVLCTGFSDGVSESMALAQGVNAFAQKPIAVEHLAAIIRRLLDRRGPATGAAADGAG